MAVTLTVEELADALRVGDSDAETAEMGRLLAYAVEACNRHAPDAPTPVGNEAAIRLAGYLFDMPDWTRNSSGADPLRNSGAQQMLGPWREHRAGIINPNTLDDEEDPMATSTQPQTVGHVTVGGTAADITAGLAAGAYRGHVFDRGTPPHFGVLVAYSANPPADGRDYFYIRPGDPFEFRAPGPVWVVNDRTEGPTQLTSTDVTIVRTGN